MLRARALPRWMRTARAYGRTLRWREASLFRRAHVRRRATYSLQRQASAACLVQRIRTGARCLWEGGAALELEARARRAALIVASPYTGQRNRAGERPLSFSARLWCDVPVEAFNAKPPPLVSRSAGAPALAVSGEEAQGSSLLCSRALPRWIRSARERADDTTALAKGLSPSARAREATCHLRPPTPSQRRVSRAAHARGHSLSLGRRRSTRA